MYEKVLLAVTDVKKKIRVCLQECARWSTLDQEIKLPTCVCLPFIGAERSRTMEQLETTRRWS